MIVELPHFCFSTPKRSFGQRVPLAFMADFGLRKVVLRAETRLANVELYGKKNF